MSILVHGGKKVYIGGGATVLPDDYAIASDHWAGRSIVANPAYKWVVGKYVQADNPNGNNQYWAHEQLVFGQPSIKHSPMNLLHQARRIVGAFVDTEMMYPMGVEAQDAMTHPYIEALGVFWRARFPQELALVERAYAEGKLFFSMECIADEVNIELPDGRSETFEFMGMTHASYGDFNDPKGVRKFLRPHFLGGALILPPAEPGWSQAEIEALAKYTEDHQDMADDVYRNLRESAPHLGEEELEQLTYAYLDPVCKAENAENSINDASMTNIDTDEQSHHSGGVTSMSDTVKTYSEAELQSAVSKAVEDATADLKSQVKDLMAKADADAVEEQITEIAAAKDSEIDELRTELDKAVLKAEEAEKAHADVVAWLEGEAQAQAEAEAREARRDERLTKVKEVASFPEEYIEANAERWTNMDDEAFEAYLSDIATVSKTAAEAKSEEESEGKEPATAMKHVRDEESETSSDPLVVMADLMGSRHDWKDAV